MNRFASKTTRNDPFYLCDVVCKWSMCTDYNQTMAVLYIILFLFQMVFSSHFSISIYYKKHHIQIAKHKEK